MSLYKRGNVWWSRVELNGEILQRSTKCRSKKLARDVEAAWRVAYAQGEVGIHDQSKAPTLVNFGPRLFEYLPAHVGKSSVVIYKQAWKPLMSYAPLATAQLHRIDQSLIADFVQFRLKQGVLPDTVNSSIRILRRALHLAEEWKLIRRCPKIKPLPGSRMREFSEEMLSKITAKGTALLVRILPFLIDTGLRIGEACNLTWDTISLEPKEGAVRGWVFVAVGKTKSAKRYIPLTERAAAILKLQKADARCQWVWTTCDGRRKLDRNYVSLQFRAVRDALGLPWDAVVHSTRHTFCTNLGERGADAFTIMKLAGHGSIMVSQRYVHPTPARLESAIGLLESSTQSSTPT